MSVLVRERPAAPAAGSARATDGGAPARRAMARWAWRLFRREWRRQALVLALLMVAVAATVVGLGAASNATVLKADPTFGTANTILVINGAAGSSAADIAALRSRFGTLDVIAHQSVPIPGSVATVDLRAQDPSGPYGHVTLRLDAGRFPAGAGEVAVTSDVARLFGLHVGGVWTQGGHTRQVVGVVENPLDLHDQFALIAPGQADPSASVSVLLNAPADSRHAFDLPSQTGVGIETRGTASRTSAEAVVLVLGSLGLLFVGLMAVAGFTVMAQRRLRALGMLGALGATDRHVRQVMLANGAAVGATAAVAGTAVGLAGWLAFVPTLQSITGHRVGEFALPWLAIAAAMVLTFVTAVAAAWWPARAVARVPAVAALSGRPPAPRPAHRFAALGGGLLATGVVLLAFADQHRTAFIIAGTVTTAVGLLLLAPLAIRALAAAAGRSTISVRLALRDLARYQARSGAALGAVTLAIGIAATIAISAAAAQGPTTAGNLPANELVVHVTAGDAGTPVPPLSPEQLQAATASVDRLAASIGAGSALPLEQAYDPQSSLLPGPPGQNTPAGYITATLAKVDRMPGGGVNVSTMVPLYVATPAVLDHFGINAAQIDPSSDVISGRGDVAGLQVFLPAPDKGTRGQPGTASRSDGVTRPNLQRLAGLPVYTSDPGTLLTSQAVQTLGLQVLPSGWLVQTPHPLSSTQIATARKAAAAAGLYVETRSVPRSNAPLRNWATASGILLALGVLGMTVGLIRSETANDLRTLTATGASSITRRNVTAATAAALAFLGALLGTAGAYAALLAWHRSDLTPLGRVPVVNLVVILAGLPAVGALGGWLLAGRQPPAIARRPLE